MSSQSSPSLPYHVKLFINGERRTSSTGTTFKEHGASGQLTAVVEEASWADIEEAIETASAAQPAWEKSPVSVRRDVLLKASAVLMDPSKGYGEAIKGAFTSALGERADWMTQYYGGAYLFKEISGMSARLNGQTFPSRLPGGTVVTQKRAHGVVLMIIPWNQPIALGVRMVSLALLAGNAVMLRSSEHSTRTQEIIAEVLHDAGLPAGVFNLIHTSRENNPTIVPKIIAHKKINFISFTGGPTVGRIIAAEAGKNLKQVLMELGGKAAAIVLDDADIEQAARCIVAGAFDTSGQICMIISRVIVQRSVADELIQKLVALIRKLKTGTGTDANLPSIRNDEFAERVVEIIQDAKDQGAEVLVGDVSKKGAVVQPHFISGYTPEMRAWKEEIFGPVLGLIVCDTVDEAIDLANNTEYSLSSSLWTTNLKALEWASRIKAQIVVVNHSSFHMEFGAGVHGLGGASGYGHGDIENFLQDRSTVVFTEKVPNPLLDNLGL